jgi:hypothetical protein
VRQMTEEREKEVRQMTEEREKEVRQMTEERETGSESEWKQVTSK